MKNLVILGSTGSIGTAALEVAASLPGRFRIVGLAAGSDHASLAAQAAAARPSAVALADERGARALARAVGKTGGVETFAGAAGVERVAAMGGAEVVLNAIVGAAGLRPTLRALEAGKTVLFANKEAAVAGGELIVSTARTAGAQLIPVDSEHSALFRLLRGSRRKEVRRLILTASGGPLLNRKKRGPVTMEEALRHPRWRMGRKVTVDSATLMNKGLEIMEAAALFGMPAERIDVVIHPECVVHAMVEYVDGSIAAHLAAPDMRLPIRAALTWPDRLSVDDGQRLDAARLGGLTFSPVPEKRFPCYALARAAAAAGGLAPAALNAADEVAVGAFLAGKMSFEAIPSVVEATINKMEREASAGDPRDEANIIAVDAEARASAGKIIRRYAVR